MRAKGGNSPLLFLALHLLNLTMDSPIPLIDFGTPQSSEQLAEQVLLALTSVGFLHVAGLPGLDKEAIANAFSIVSSYMQRVLTFTDACNSTRIFMTLPSPSASRAPTTLLLVTGINGLRICPWARREEGQTVRRLSFTVIMEPNSSRQISPFPRRWKGG